MRGSAGRVPTGGATALAAWVLHLQGYGAPLRDAGAEHARAAVEVDDLRTAVVGVLDVLAPGLGSDTPLVEAVVAPAYEVARPSAGTSPAARPTSPARGRFARRATASVEACPPRTAVLSLPTTASTRAGVVPRPLLLTAAVLGLGSAVFAAWLFRHPGSLLGRDPEAFLLRLVLGPRATAALLGGLGLAAAAGAPLARTSAAPRGGGRCSAWPSCRWRGGASRCRA